VRINSGEHLYKALMYKRGW